MTKVIALANQKGGQAPRFPCYHYEQGHHGGANRA